MSKHAIPSSSQACSLLHTASIARGCSIHVPIPILAIDTTACTIGITAVPTATSTPITTVANYNTPIPAVASIADGQGA